MKNKQKKEIEQVSNCCRAKLVVIQGNEGTSYNTCSSCIEPCDIYVAPTKQSIGKIRNKLSKQTDDFYRQSGKCCEKGYWNGKTHDSKPIEQKCGDYKCKKNHDYLGRHWEEKHTFNHLQSKAEIKLIKEHNEHGNYTNCWYDHHPRDCKKSAKQTCEKHNRVLIGKKKYG